MSIQNKIRLKFALVILLTITSITIAYPKTVKFIPPVFEFVNKAKINLGLDLQGGYRLEYEVDTSKVEEDKKEDAVQAAQDVLERKVNATGTSEALIQTVAGTPPRIIIEYPGAKSAEDLKSLIKETPYLIFKEEKNEEEQKAEKQKFNELLAPNNEKSRQSAAETLQKIKEGGDFNALAKEFNQDPGSKDKDGVLDFVKKGDLVPQFDEALFNGNLKNGEYYPELVETDYGWHIIKKLEEKGEGENREIKAQHILLSKQTAEMYRDYWIYKDTELTGKNLKDTAVVFTDQGVSEPQVQLKFDGDGARIFAEITKRNMGKQVAIYLDDEIISAPTVQAEITAGEAVITGNFTVDEAKELKRRLNEGALPVPIKLVSQQSIGASLGKVSLEKSLKAGVAGLAIVGIFMILYYRFFGFIATIALFIYSAMMISVFKLSGVVSDWPITLTLSGIAGFILSIGMAVDANVLIFERIKEELRDGRNLGSAINEGFRRAWSSIRDGNYSTIITSMILIWVGTGFVKGFAVILTIGVVLSMFTAIVLVKIILQAIVGEWISKRLWLVVRKK
ncbi:MAG: Protein translocase subunit SecD [Candidatus Moranbacteria bacterium GW2011_GWF2_34_56]|nr:MAG: Protein translocase subunit SecD [Candidatus Moranbacteria bacterium GW2011_GWF1_34_10]KKP64621.1 MAG: Protein translocase subunit SecD [Candidatus Moranbacteria bacterium GW2011_GWF2_34_56]HBI17117.1 protein translocase subunit SecD [Candidatus Moranbacteria bacterium]